MNRQTPSKKHNRFYPLLLSGLTLACLAPSAWAQASLPESCSDMIQQHGNWLSQGIISSNGQAALSAGVTGTMSSHQLPNNTTSSNSDSVQYASTTIFGVDRNHNLVFTSPLQISPTFTLSPSITVQVTVTPGGAVTVQPLLNGAPNPFHPADSFTATCVGNALTGYANGIQYSIGLQDTKAVNNPL